MMEEKQLYIVSVIRVGNTYDGDIELEVRYSDEPENVWGDDFAEQVPSVCPLEGLIPYGENIRYVRKITVPRNVYLSLVTENSCFSMQDCIDGIIQMAWVKNGRNYIGISYGETMENSDIFFKTIGGELGELSFVNIDTGNNEEETDTETEKGGSDFDW